MKLRACMLVVALIGFVAAAAGTGVRATYGARVTADEPQYLLTAISIGEDLSLDISDEIADRRFEPFHEITIDRQTEPQADGSEISPHDPLLPFVLAAPMAAGGWVAAKLTLAVVSGILGAVLLWTAVRRFGVPMKAAATVTALFVASAPFAVYGNQVYPELPAAVAVACGIAVLIGPLGRRGLVGLGAAVVALPWLSVKYVPVAAALAIAALWLLRRESRVRAALYLSMGLIASGLVFVAAHVAWYGSVTAYATGDHFASTGEFSVVGTNVDLLGRSRRLIGLLVDDKFGLAVWQPAFLLALPALGALVRAKPSRFGVLLGVAAAGWLNATFVALTMQGYWWPGRQTVIVLPALVLAIAWWVGDSSRRLALAAGLGALGVVSYAWLVVEGLARRLTWVVDFFETSNPYFWVATRITPDYLAVTSTTWLLHAFWLAIAAALVWWGYRSELLGGRFGSGAATAGGAPGARSGTGAGTRAADVADAASVVVTARSPE